LDMDGAIRPQDGNGDGTTVCDIGAYECPLNLGAAKRTYTNGSSIALGGFSVTAVFPADQQIYVERQDRVSGIRVNTSETFGLGQILNLSGVITTDFTTGERYVQPSPPWPDPTGANVLLAPVGLNNVALGGGAFGLQQGIADAIGLNNIGLLVTVWGKFTYRTPTMFTIDDGSGVNVKCRVPSGGLLDPTWTYVQVTGISSCEKAYGQIKRLLRVRGSGDIVPLK